MKILRANVSKEAALAELEPAGLRRFVSPPLRKLAEIYVPFRLFRVAVLNAESREERFFALDAVRGYLDVVQFDGEPPVEECDSKNTIPPKSSLEESATRVAEHVRRMVFKKGFFKVKDLKIEPQLVAEFGYPYWVGFYGSGELASLVIIDAVRRRREGGKVKELVREWLQSDEVLSRQD